MAGHGENFQGEKNEYIYKRVTYYFLSTWKIKYLIVFCTEIFVSKMFSKVSNKNFGEITIKYIIFQQDGK